MKRIAFLAVLAMAGCMENEPPKPHPAMVALQSACDKGDTTACAEILAVEQRNQALRQQAGAQFARQMQENSQATMQANTDLFSRSMNQPTYQTPVPVVIQPGIQIGSVRGYGY